MRILLMLIVLFILAVFSLRPDEYCLDNNKHLDLSDGYDYKKYEPVRDCSCACWRYRQDFKRGRCTQCLHFRAPRQIDFNGHNHRCTFLETELPHQD